MKMKQQVKKYFLRSAVLTILLLSCLIITTIIGNILVILSVLNHAPLKILSNYFVVSLAVADLTVSYSTSQAREFQCFFIRDSN